MIAHSQLSSQYSKQRFPPTPQRRLDRRLLEIVREGDIVEVALPEMGNLCIALVGIERVGFLPLISLGLDHVRPRETSRDLSLNKAPEEG